MFRQDLHRALAWGGGQSSMKRKQASYAAEAYEVQVPVLVEIRINLGAPAGLPRTFTQTKSP